MKMWHRDMKWEITVGKMVPIYLFDTGCHKPSVSKKCSICNLNEIKTSKTGYVYVFLEPTLGKTIWENPEK